MKKIIVDYVTMSEGLDKSLSHLVGTFPKGSANVMLLVDGKVILAGEYRIDKYQSNVHSMIENGEKTTQRVELVEIVRSKKK